jgi:hypothetical protein
LLHRPPIGVTSSASRCPEDDDDDDELLPDELLPVEAAVFDGCDAAPPSAICCFCFCLCF